MILVRIAVRGRSTFDKLSGGLADEKAELADEGTFVGLLKFMEIPKDKGLMAQRLKDMRGRKASANKRDVSEPRISNSKNKSKNKETKELKILGPDGKEENWGIKK